MKKSRRSVIVRPGFIINKDVNLELIYEYARCKMQKYSLLVLSFFSIVNSSPKVYFVSVTDLLLSLLLLLLLNRLQILSMCMK